MGRKLRLMPAQEQIEIFQNEIKNIDQNIKRAMSQKRALQNRIRFLQRPDADERIQRRIKAHNRSMAMREDADACRLKAARAVEECLRMNGKL